MWNKFMGKSNGRGEDTTSQSTQRKDSDRKSTRRRSETSNPSRKPSRGDDRDDRDNGINPASKSYSSTTRSPFPATAAASVTKKIDEEYLPPGLMRNASLADQLPKTRSERDEGDEDDSRKRKSGRRRARSLSRDGKVHPRAHSTSLERKTNSKKDNRINEEGIPTEKQVLGKSDGGENIKASQSFGNQVGSAGFMQFPGQYDGPTSGFIGGPVVSTPRISDHIQDQFPGQFPIQSTAPYRPPLAAKQGGPGLAAEYYGDAGQSVAEQPGVRPHPPDLVVGAEPHLQAASSTTAPPPEPSASGAVGAAASFFDGTFNTDVEEQASYHVSSGTTNAPVYQQVSGMPSSTTQNSSSIRPDSIHHSSSVPVIPTLGAATAGAAAGIFLSNQSSSHQQRPHYTSSAGGNAQGEISLSTNPHLQSQPQIFDPISSSAQSVKPTKHSSSQSSHLPAYAAGMAGAAGLAAAAYQQTHHSVPNSSSGQQYQATTMSQRHRHRGPLSKLVDFFKDPDGVAQFEEYTEFIGVCKYCFAPGSSPKDAPRKHHYRHRRSNERLGSSTRVGKDHRYWSSDGESRHMNKKSWLATGIAGYSLAKVGESLFNQDHGFDDSNNIQSGRDSSPHEHPLGRRNSHSRNRKGYSSHGVSTRSSIAGTNRRSHSKDRVETGITSDGKLYKKNSHGGKFGGSSMKIYDSRRRSKSRSRSRSRSRSKNRKSEITESAIGAAIGSSVLVSGARHRSRSPKKNFVRPRRRSEEQGPDPTSGWGKGKHDDNHRDGRSRRSPSPSRIDVSRSSHQKGSERRHKSHKKAKKSKGFFSFSNGSSSSSSDGNLTFGIGSEKRRIIQSKGRERERHGADAALMGLGAAAAALALNETRHKGETRRKGELVAVKEFKNNHAHNSQYSSKIKKKLSSLNSDEDMWVSASEEEYASADSNLAYGRSSRASSQESLSDSSGTRKWGWRWGSKERGKDLPKKQRTNNGTGLPVQVGPAFVGLSGSATGASFSPDGRQITKPSNSSHAPLQHVYPISTSDPSRFDVAIQSSTMPSNQPSVVSRPAPIPIQHPQPVAPVPAAVYTSQPPYSHAYSAPVGDPVFYQDRHQAQPATAGDRPRNYITTPDKIPGSFPQSDQPPYALGSTAKNIELGTRDASSTTHASELASDSILSRRQDEASAVRFDLTEEQAEKDRHERRRQKQEDDDRREKRRQEQEDKARQDRLRQEREDKDRRERRRQKQEDDDRREKRRQDLEDSARQDRLRQKQVDQDRLEKSRQELEESARREKIRQDLEDRARKDRLRHEQEDEDRRQKIRQDLEEKNRREKIQQEQEELDQLKRSEQQAKEERGQLVRGRIASEDSSSKTGNYRHEDIWKAEMKEEKSLPQIVENEPRKTSSWPTQVAPGIMVATNIVAAKADETKSDIQRDERHEQNRSQHEYHNGSDINETNQAFQEDIPKRLEDVDRNSQSMEEEPTSVWQAVAKVKRSSSHEDYATYFAPSEILSKSDDRRQITNANADNNITNEDPEIITIEPRGFHDSSHSPAYSFTPTGDEADAHIIDLPWVPRLNLIAPTPSPSRAGSLNDRMSPINQPVGVNEVDDEEPSKSITDPKVSWGEPETIEYTVVTPMDQRDQFIESPSSDNDDVKEKSRTPGGIDSEKHEQPWSLEGTKPGKSDATYDDDLEFAAVLAAGLEDTGFDPSVVIDDPSFRRRDSPPRFDKAGTNERSPKIEAGKTNSPPSGLVSLPQTGFDEGEISSIHMPGAFDEDEAEDTISKRKKKKRDQASKRKGLFDTLPEVHKDRSIIESPEIPRETSQQPQSSRAKLDDSVRDVDQESNGLKDRKPDRFSSADIASGVEEPAQLGENDMLDDEFFDATGSLKKSLDSKARSSEGLQSALTRSASDKSSNDFMHETKPTVSDPLRETHRRSESPTTTQSSNHADLYESPSEDALSIAATPPVSNDVDEGKKSRKKSKRKSSGFADAASLVSSSGAHTSNTSRKEKKGKRGTFSLFSRSTENTSESPRPKEAFTEATAEDFEEPKKRSKKSENRKSSRQGSRHGSRQGESLSGQADSPLPLENIDEDYESRMHKSKGRKDRRRSTGEGAANDSGRITQDLPAKVYTPASIGRTLPNQMLTIKKDQEGSLSEEVRGVGTGDNLPTSVDKENRLQDSLPMSFLGMRQEIPPLPDTPNALDSSKLQEDRSTGDIISSLQNSPRQNSDSPIAKALDTPKPQESRSISDLQDSSHQDYDTPNSVTLESPKPKENESVGDIIPDLQDLSHEDALEFPKLKGDRSMGDVIYNIPNLPQQDRNSPTSDAINFQKQQGDEPQGNIVSNLQNLSHQESDTLVSDQLEYPSLQENKPMGKTTSNNQSLPHQDSDAPTFRALDDGFTTSIDSRPSSPASKLSNQERRLSEIQSKDEIVSYALTPSPTAVPFHFRRPPSSPASVRSHSSFPLSSADAIPSFVPSRQKPRPRSTEFKSSNEFRPLWLVERHSSRQEPSLEEIYPSLPSSHSTSRTSSVQDTEEHDHQQGPAHEVAFDLVDTNYKPDTKRCGLLIETNQDDAQSDLLDSQQQTPTAPSSQSAMKEETALEAEVSQEVDSVPTGAPNVRDLSFTNTPFSQEPQMGKGLSPEEEEIALEAKANQELDLVPTGASIIHDQSFANVPPSRGVQMREDSISEEMTNHGPSIESFSPSIYPSLSTEMSPLQQPQIEHELALDDKMHKFSEHHEPLSSPKSASPYTKIPSSQQLQITEGIALENKIQQEPGSFEPVGSFANSPAYRKTPPLEQLQTQGTVASKQDLFQEPESLANVPLSPESPEHDVVVEESRSIVNASSSPLSSSLTHDIVQETKSISNVSLSPKSPEHDVEESRSIANASFSPTTSSLKQDIVQEPKSIANISRSPKTQVLEHDITQDSESLAYVSLSPKSPEHDNVIEESRSITNASSSPTSSILKHDIDQEAGSVPNVSFSSITQVPEHDIIQKLGSIANASFSPTISSLKHDVVQEPTSIAKVPLSPTQVLGHDIAQEPDSVEGISFSPKDSSSEHDIAQEPGFVANTSIFPEPSFLAQPQVQERATLDHETIQVPESGEDDSLSEHDITREPKLVANASLVSKPPFFKQPEPQERATLEHDTVQESESIAHISLSPKTPSPRLSPINENAALEGEQSVPQGASSSPNTPLPHQSPINEDVALKEKQSIPQTISFSPKTSLAHQSPINEDVALKEEQSVPQGASSSPKTPLPHQSPINEDVALEEEQPIPQAVSFSPETPLSHQFSIGADAALKDEQSSPQTAPLSPETLQRQFLTNEEAVLEDEQIVSQVVSLSPRTPPTSAPKAVSIFPKTPTLPAIQSVSFSPNTLPHQSLVNEDVASEDEQQAPQAVSISPKTQPSLAPEVVSIPPKPLLHESPLNGGMALEDKQSTPQAIQFESTQVPRPKPRSPSPRLQSDALSDPSYHSVDTGIATRSKSESIENHAVEATLGAGLLGSGIVQQIDSKKDKKKDKNKDKKAAKKAAKKTAKKGGKSSKRTDFEDHEESTSVDPTQLDNLAVVDQLSKSGPPTSVDAWQQSQDTPLSTNKDIDTHKSDDQTSAFILENPTNRDSAIHVSDSPLIPEPLPIHHAVRDSGYRDAELSPRLDLNKGFAEKMSEQPKEDVMDRLARDIEPARNVDDQNDQSLYHSKSSSANPLNISVEVDSDYDISISRPGFKRERSRSSSKVTSAELEVGLSKSSENLQTAGPVYESFLEQSPADSVQVTSEKQERSLFGRKQSSENLHTAGLTFENPREQPPTESFKPTGDDQEMSLFGRNQSSETLQTAGPVFGNPREPSPANSSKALGDDQEVSFPDKNQNSKYPQTASPVFGNPRELPSATSTKVTSDEQQVGFFGRNQSSENLQTADPIPEDPRQPSPVSSTTKDRSSMLFLSSPSTREDITHRSSEREGPLDGRMDWEGLDKDDVEDWSQPVDFPKNNGHIPAAEPPRIPTVSDKPAAEPPWIPPFPDEPSDKERPSIFGGPVGMTENIRTPSRSPFASDHSNRQKLNTITEYSPEESPLHKKNRSLSDVGSPERGVKSRRRAATPQGGSQLRIKSPPLSAEAIIPRGGSQLRMKSPLGAEATIKNSISIDDLATRLSWPPVDEENYTVDLGRSRSGNTTDQTTRRQDTWSALTSGRTKQHESERRSLSGASAVSVGSVESINAIIRTPDQIIRSASGLSQRGSGTPPLRRSDRSVSGDLRVAHKNSEAKNLAKAYAAEPDVAIPSSSTYDPTKDKGKTRVRDMADIYEGWGDVRQASPRSPTRPPSMRRRQSLQVLDLETKVDQLVSEKRLLQDAKSRAEKNLEVAEQDRSQQHSTFTDAIQSRDLFLKQKDSELIELRQLIETLQGQVSHLTEVNEGLTAARADLDEEHEQRYSQLEADHSHTHQQWQQSTRELDEIREQHTQLSTGMEQIVRREVSVAVEEKNRELRKLRDELEAAKEQVRVLQQQILASKSLDDPVIERDEDYFDTQCQQLCGHVQQWVLRFSKFSDSKACYLASEISDAKITDRFENAILDGSDVDIYLQDRVKRRDVFMSVVMTMVWQYIFTRYLFGMDREQRQKLKQLEKTLSEVGPATAINRWRATTLTLLVKRESFPAQRAEDTEAVVQEIYQTLATFLPPPVHLVNQIQDSLRSVMGAAVDLSIEMRTQRAEYVMLTPLQPEYDTNGDLARKVYFIAATMNERSGLTSSNEALEAQQAVVRMVLFPPVVKRGGDSGMERDEIVICPAQVLTAKEPKNKKVVRVVSAQGGRSTAGSFGGSVEGGMASAVDLGGSDVGMGNMI